MNKIEDALKAARYAFDRYAQHHLEQWQAIKCDPLRSDQAAMQWGRYKDCSQLGAKIRDVLANKRLRDEKTQ